ncbi:RNA polymerase factor sigma-54 [Acidihalobacter yilgarnensis]|uniref:RNA polymerase sigma-54 factor n=1 Tax=Acidihalobacter yilgarnensis TaxID=2819280 RepID=A0A1D8ITC0_9GAMM|nr:RNA polymerase factor sigma-54 [Acidihalobacter yilgarnensis]
MKPSLQLRLGQSLAMTPQLQQAIRLLQYSTLELQTHIQEVLETNPMLEVDEDSGRVEGADGEQINGESREGAAEDNPSQDTIPDELPVDSAWDDIYEPPTAAGSGSSEADDRDPYESQSGDGESLIDHLLWQVHLAPMNEQDRLIAMTLIDSIGGDGYLQEDIENIRGSLAAQLQADLEIEDIEAVLHLVQRLDPPGCGARNLAECLDIQLSEMPQDIPWLIQARRLVQSHIDLLGNHDLKALMRHLELDEAGLQETIALIQSLNPRPGAQISNSRPEYIVPDVTVRKQGQRWRVELNSEVAPRLRLNSTYASMVRRADSSVDNTYMKNQLQEARWFIKSLQSRNETLLRVATAIVEQQRGFLEYGEEAMKPLVLRDIAEQVEMHESTISRVTTQKYMYTPRGIFEFKYFFSSHVGTADGGECSAVAIRAMIRKLVESEPGDKPLSDSKIADLLSEKGIQVARRTVAKYREGMNIPSSSDRKRLN